MHTRHSTNAVERDATQRDGGMQTGRRAKRGMQTGPCTKRNKGLTLKLVGINCPLTMLDE
jgi:hypothetical protein